MACVSTRSLLPPDRVSLREAWTPAWHRAGGPRGDSAGTWSRPAGTGAGQGGGALVSLGLGRPVVRSRPASPAGGGPAPRQVLTATRLGPVTPAAPGSAPGLAGRGAQRFPPLPRSAARGRGCAAEPPPGAAALAFQGTNPRPPSTRRSRSACHTGGRVLEMRGHQTV